MFVYLPTQVLPYCYALGCGPLNDDDSDFSDDEEGNIWPYLHMCSS